MKRTLALAFVMAFGTLLASLPSHADDGCTNASLAAPYGFSRSGTAGFGTLSAVAAGVIVFDGVGNISGHDTTSVNGNIIRRTFSGTYTVNPDCTGSLIVNFLTGTPGRVSPNDFVIVEKGRELLLINTNPGEVILGNAKRQAGGEQ
jgi:hypothetical protein